MINISDIYVITNPRLISYFYINSSNCSLVIRYTDNELQETILKLTDEDHCNDIFKELEAKLLEVYNKY